MFCTDPVPLSTNTICPPIGPAAASAMSRPSGDQAGGMLGRQGATSEIHGEEAPWLASTRSCPPSAFATNSCDDSAGLNCVRRNAMLLAVWCPRDGARHVGDQQSGRAAKKRHAPNLPRRSVLLTNEVDRCAIGRKRGAEECHASLGWDNPPGVRGRRLTYPQAGVVTIALHVGDVSPVGRDRRPLCIAAGCQLRDLKVSERLLARRRFGVWPQQPVESGRSDEEQHGSGDSECPPLAFDQPHHDLRV